MASASSTNITDNAPKGSDSHDKIWALAKLGARRTKLNGQVAQATVPKEVGLDAGGT